MTMPAERTRALRWAREFMKEVRSCDDVPAHFREQAHRILRHYPEIYEIELQAKFDKHSGIVQAWLAPEENLNIK